ncbi:MAG TPA: ABC transporter permease [Dehalococcoidia bacterium]|nr:ABC transporter permease [Dehalococcoidia bacterium]
MDLWESVRTALVALMAHRLRTILAVLGIVIGVGAVITLLAIGSGQQELITARVRGLGTNLLFVRPGFQMQQGVRGAVGTAPTLTYDDAIAIQQEVPSVVAVAPEWGTNGQVIAGGQNVNTRLQGVTPEYFEVRNLRLNGGSFITEGDMNSRATVAVLGANAAQNLFSGADPLDQTLRVRVGSQTLALRVVGVMAPIGGTGQGSLDENVFVPLTTILARVAAQRAARGVPNVNTINVEVENQKLLPQAMEAIDQLLRQRHRVAEPDFVITSQQDILATLTTISDSETILMSSIAAISLLVGGIGIMNIMLVSVTERTREIGIRKALGARRRNILQQFLVEALVVSIAGGLLGVMLGVGLARLASGHTFGGRLMYTIITPESVLLAFLVSAVIGIFFGIYPAMRASRLNPVDALRYE